MKLVRLLAWAPLTAALVTSLGCSRPAPETASPRYVRTAVVGSLASGSAGEYAGEIRARVEARLSFRVPGKLVGRSANLGDSVRRGQVLAQLDPADLRLSQDAAQAALQSAQVNLDQATLDLKRYQDLRTEGFISAAELERRESAWKVAQAQHAQAVAQARVQSNQAGYAQLVADAPGIVTGVEAEPGMVLAAGNTVVRVAQEGPRDVVFSVPEQEVGLARSWLGQAGKLSVSVWGDDVARPAVVREVAGAADPASRTFLVKADVGRADVRLGQTATVRRVGEVPKAGAGVGVPLAAVARQGDEAFVWVVDAKTMKVAPQTVKLGGAQGGQWMVTEGLRPGQEIVTAGVHVLTAGEVVRRYAESRTEGAAAAASR